MKNSYKKRLYTQALSLSAAVLLAVLAQGNAAADTLNPAETPQDNQYTDKTGHLDWCGKNRRTCPSFF